MKWSNSAFSSGDNPCSWSRSIKYATRCCASIDGRNWPTGLVRLMTFSSYTVWHSGYAGYRVHDTKVRISIFSSKNEPGEPVSDMRVSFL